MIATFIVGCGKEDSSSTSSSAFVVKGSSSQMAKLHALVPSGSPTSFKVKIYSAYISENEDCSSPVLLKNFGTAGVEFDMYSSPTLFGANPPEGTYNCFILNISDNMKFKADATAVADHVGCTSTTVENTFDIYRDGDTDDGLWVDIDGNRVNATGSDASPGADSVFIFASTNPGAIVLAHTNQVLTLATALVSPGQTTYYWDATGGVDNNNDGINNYCGIENVVTGFR